MSHPQEIQQITNLTPILRVSDFSASMAYYVEKLGFTNAWEHGEPPTFGCVKRDAIELFLCLGSQGQPGTWISMFVLNVDVLYAELCRRGANVVRHPVDEPWGMREMLVEDPDGHTFRFGSRISRKDFKVKRTAIEAQLEERLALVLRDLASITNRSLGEVLEETLLHSFEAVPGVRGAVASPHTPATLELIDELKRKHSLDYDTHDSYRFTED